MPIHQYPASIYGFQRFRLNDLFRTTKPYHSAAIQQHDSIAILTHQIQIMGYKNNGESSFFLELSYDPTDIDLVL